MKRIILLALLATVEVVAIPASLRIEAKTKIRAKFGARCFDDYFLRDCSGDFELKRKKKRKTKSAASDVELRTRTDFVSLEFPASWPKLYKWTSTQGSHCDPNLQQPRDDPNGYRLRGDRCEGVYIKEVAGTITVASLTEYVEDFNPSAGPSLRAEWSALGNGSVHLRAYSLRHRLYYQMDSQRPAGSSSYDWPTNVLSPLNLKKAELGIVAFTSYQAGDKTHEVYLPVSIRQQAIAKNPGGYQLVLMPDAEVDNVFLTLAAVKNDGSVGPSFKDWALGPGYYPAGRAIRIPIKQVKSPGIYFLKVSATFKAGGASTQPVWFYHH